MSFYRHKFPFGIADGLVALTTMDEGNLRLSLTRRIPRTGDNLVSHLELEYVHTGEKITVYSGVNTELAMHLHSYVIHCITTDGDFLADLYTSNLDAFSDTVESDIEFARR